MSTGPSSPLTRAALLADLEAHAFGAPISASLTPRRVGAEAEFIPVDTATWRRCSIEGTDGAAATTATLPFLRRHGDRNGWVETRTAKGTPAFLLPCGGTLTFERGAALDCEREHADPLCRI